MSLPLSIQNKLRIIYDGSPAANFDNSLEARNFEAELEYNGISYKTRIIKHKKRAREFVVMVLSPDGS